MFYGKRLKEYEMVSNNCIVVRGYDFDELSEDAKKIALKELNSRYDDTYRSDFYSMSEESNFDYVKASYRLDKLHLDVSYNNYFVKSLELEDWCTFHDWLIEVEKYTGTKST